jgi:predicted RNA-binding protein YlxR (DUF448 family)
MPKTRREPVRTCVACRQEAGKRELVRVVRDPGTIEVRLDPTGRAPGRGAYLHRSTECVEGARRRGALSRALKAEVPASVWEALGLASNRPG